MRDDLNKQLCERQRAGSAMRYKPHRHARAFNPEPGEEWENWPQRERMGARYGHNHKEFSDNLNPLWGVIRCAVGRRYDEFYSELRARFDMNRVVNQHIVQHLDTYLEKNVYVAEDGELTVHGSGREMPLKYSSARYYVDPLTRTICRNRAYQTYGQRQRAARARTEVSLSMRFRVLDAHQVLRLVGGVWYVYAIAPVPQGRLTYQAPQKPALFVCDRGRLSKTWEQLTPAEQARFGVARLDGAAVEDIYCRARLWREGSRVRCLQLEGDEYGRCGIAYGMYHVSRRCAPRSILRQAGLVGGQVARSSLFSASAPHGPCAIPTRSVINKTNRGHAR